MNNMPERSILLLEDIDTAFNNIKTMSQNQKLNSTPSRSQFQVQSNYKTRITFSGLLNALDVVTSSEKTITFMTMNSPKKLDPAIMRPGSCRFQDIYWKCHTVSSRDSILVKRIFVINLWKDSTF